MTFHHISVNIKGAGSEIPEQTKSFGLTLENALSKNNTCLKSTVNLR